MEQHIHKIDNKINPYNGQQKFPRENCILDKKQVKAVPWFILCKRIKIS